MFSEKLLEITRGIKNNTPRIDMADSAVFHANLMFVSQVIKASAGLLMEATMYLPQDGGSFERELRLYYCEHLKEEQGHYEWLMDDLELKSTIGHRDWAAAQVCGAQYYMLKHIHPVCLLGHMVALECDPTSVETIEQLEALYGRRMLRCARFHAVEDLEHQKELLAIVDKVPEHLQPLVTESAIHTLQTSAMAQQYWGK